MDRYLLDLRSAFRAILRDRGTSLIAVAVLAMGIGFPTTMFSIVRGGTRSLPFSESEELVAVARVQPPYGRDMQTPAFDYLQWSDQQQSFEGLAAFTTTGVNLSGDGSDAVRYSGAGVTPEAFSLLGVTAAIGRVFAADDAVPGAQPVVLLSHGLWVDRFATDAGVVGDLIRVDGVLHEVVGVMPEDFAFPIRSDLWLPLGIRVAEAVPGAGPDVTVFGRLRDAVGIEQASIDLATVADRLARANPATHAGVGVEVLPFTEMETPKELRYGLYVMVGAVSLVLLIACANVANLLLARAATRTHDIALRGALGAPRGRIMSVHLFESVILAGAGAALGLLFAGVGVQYFATATANILEAFWMDFRVDWLVAAYACTLGFVAAIAAGLAPAVRASRLQPGSSLREKGGGSPNLRMGRLSRGLIGAQVAFACALLILTAVFVRSALGLRAVEFAYDANEIFTAQVGFPQAESDPLAERQAQIRPITEAMLSVPEVRAAAVTSAFPGRENGGSSFGIDGETYDRPEDRPETVVTYVTPGYLDVLGATPVRGRDFTWTDDATSPTVALVNEPWVATFSPDQEPIGRRVSVGALEAEIVGVVPHLNAWDVEESRQDAIYVPVLQAAGATNVRLIATVAGHPLAATPSIRAAIATVDPDLPVFEVYTLRDAIYLEKRVLDAFGALFLVFGVGALFMTVVGLYGVVSFAVRRRTREIGIRVALGAKARDVASLVVREGSRSLVLGTSVGLVLAFGVSTLLSAAIEPLEPAQIGLYFAVTAIIAGTTLASLLLPVRSALLVQPARALKAE